MTVFKVLITGASGLLGRAVYKYFTDESFREKYPVSTEIRFHFDCLGLCYSRAKDNLRAADLNDFEQVDQLVDEFKPNAVIHCAAERRVEVVDGDFDKALKINVSATEHLAKLCAEQGIYFVYISTDYVFDGKNPPYKIDSIPNPLNKYGLSKLKGEEVTQQASKHHCIIRVPILYGTTESMRFNESAVNILYEKVAKGESFSIDNVQARFPTHCVDVARFIFLLLSKRFETQSESYEGILHCSAFEQYTKYTMSLIIADQMGLSKEHIHPDDSAATQTSSSNSTRPQNAQLDTKFTFELLGFKPIMNFREQIKDCLVNFA